MALIEHKRLILNDGKVGWIAYDTETYKASFGAFIAENIHTLEATSSTKLRRSDLRFGC